ncbi:hypothetical protein NLJ89_g2711 [Agrocybe chaxingu]|uniref:Uncharacterized protein n=1 Tax=Agrocybe chaxingu TaxID=84603 RepID=A0A9W8KBZ6_9AGAR|nr:hypothetical protein NLJ89_g2711 [Agrocybe chaxingu]
MSGGAGRTSKVDDSIPAPRGKRHKRFLEKKDALSLAVSIAEAQEEKAQTKAEKHHKIQVVDDQKNERKLPSSTKAKLRSPMAFVAKFTSEDINPSAALSENRVQTTELAHPVPKLTLVDDKPVIIGTATSRVQGSP